MLSPVGRAAISLILLSGWMILLFSGWAFGGLTHLLLAATLFVFPWRTLRSPDGG